MWPLHGVTTGYWFEVMFRGTPSREASAQVNQELLKPTGLITVLPSRGAFLKKSVFFHHSWF